MNSTNLIRYELQIKLANKVLGKVTVNDINDDRYLMNIVNMWKIRFHKIKKNRNIIDIESINIENYKDFIHYLVCKGMEKSKKNSYILLNKLCKIGSIDRRRKYDLKKRIDNSERKFCMTCKYIEELETLIDQYVEGFIRL